jgi:hypothetical protein
MKEPHLRFVWHVTLGGHQWVETHLWNEPHENCRRFLTNGRPMGGAGIQVRQYQPLLMFSGLFLTFAETQPTPDRIQGFADQFGLLGGDFAKQIVLYGQGSEDRGLVGIGEASGDWEMEILAMRQTVDLWEAARRGDVERLERHITWHEDGTAVRYDSHPDLKFDQLPGPPFHADRTTIAQEGDVVFGHFARGDLMQPALQYVQSIINRRLQGRASPRLVWNTATGQRTLCIVPHGLIGALWLQLARAFERNAEFRRCAECGTWFEIARGRARADRLYCSHPCRTRVYRKRQAEAARLQAEGRPLEEIARELDSDPDTVRGWLARKGGTTGPGTGEIK